MSRYYILLARLPTSSGDLLLTGFQPAGSTLHLVFHQTFSPNLLPWYAGTRNYGPLFTSPTSSHVLSPSSSQPVSFWPTCSVWNSNDLSCPRALSVGSLQGWLLSFTYQFPSGPNKGGPVTLFVFFITLHNFLFLNLPH